MRQNKFIATKDHFLMIAASNEVGDSLWAGHVEFRSEDGTFETRTSNTIAFIVRRSVNTFVNSSETEEDWSYCSNASSPVGLIRKNFNDFGVVASSNSVVFGGILSKKDIFTGQTKHILKGNIEPHEKYKIESTSDTVNVSKKCKVYKKRDVNTFVGIDQESLNINVIPDSDIQVEVEE